MRTLSGAPRGDGDMGTVVKGLNDKIDVLTRRLSRLTKIPDPVTGGGPIGMAQVYSNNGTVVANAGESAVVFNGVTYQAPTDPNGYDPTGATQIPLADWVSISGASITLASGWYIPVMYLRVVWGAEADAPSALGAFMGGGYDAPHQDYSTFPKTRVSTSLWGIASYVNYGPTFVEDGSPFRMECQSVSGLFAANNDASQSSCNWNFTKLT